MACERWREMLSAQLDGEDDPADRGAVDAHLAGCAGCREWLDRAAAVNRLTSTSMATPPDLSAAILAARPGQQGDVAARPGELAARQGELAGRPSQQGEPAARPGRQGELAGQPRRRGDLTAVKSLPAAASAGAASAGGAASVGGAFAVGASAEAGASAGGASGKRRFLAGLSLAGRVQWGRFPIAAVLIVALAVVGAVQLILGLDQIGGGVVGAHVHTGLDATPGHLWHESAAWNVAVGAGYLFIALRRTRPSGLIPMLTAFVGTLLLLSVNDLTAGRVDLTRLISHGFVILGYLMIVALSRIPGGFVTTPPGSRATEGGVWRAHFGEDGDEELAAEPFRPGLRLVPPGPMTAQHDERRAA